jgi:hypothetical protein
MDDCFVVISASGWKQFRPKVEARNKQVHTQAIYNEMHKSSATYGHVSDDGTGCMQG